MKKKSIIVRYQCPYCFKAYKTAKEAEACRDKVEDSSSKPGLDVGDFVIIPASRSYNSDHSKWLAFVRPADKKSKNHFDHDDQFHHWYVVIGVAFDQSHRKLVVVWTGDKEAYRQIGWNVADGSTHHGMYRPGSEFSGDFAKDSLVHTNPAYKALADLIKKASVPKLLRNCPAVKAKIAEYKAGGMDVPLL